MCENNDTLIVTIGFILAIGILAGSVMYDQKIHIDKGQVYAPGHWEKIK